MKILLGLSGGVDSAYAVHKLRLMGHTVEGAVIKMHEFTEISEAKAVADSLGIPLHVINGEEPFKEKVISDFIEEYRAGRTPNPCVVCNGEVKFKLLYEYAVKNGFDKIATGHYADVAVIEEDGIKRYAVKRSLDSRKDQTYMLWRLPQEILASLLFPLSDMTKDAVKEKSREISLSAVNREESQEICFIPDNDYASYIEKASGKSEEGDFIDENGKVLGRHKGIIHYTVGQRKGLGIALGERAFITSIDPKANTITLSLKDSHATEFMLDKVVFSGLSELKKGACAELLMKHRYLSPFLPARLEALDFGRIKVVLKEPARALTPGQSAVFYKDGILMLGGIIDEVL